MQVLVGIPTHKRPALLRKCLDSIAVQEGELPAVCVFVADNDREGREGVKLVEEIAGTYRFPITATCVEEPGISAVRNAILDEARRCGAEFIAMIDDDVRAARVWLSTLISCATDSGADIVAGPIDYEFVGDPPASRMRAFWTDPRPTGSPEVVDGTTAVLIRSDALAAQNWPQFDLEFGLTGGGDKEWFVRLKNLGATFSWDSRARATEEVPPNRWTRSWIIRRRFRIGIDDVRIATRHQTAKFKYSLIAKSCATLLASPISLVLILRPEKRYLIVGKWARASGRIAAGFGLVYREYAERHEHSFRSDARIS